MNKSTVYAAIIGGGASGMLCAIRAAERHPDHRIVVIERADRVGKKLLVTGNGRCNLTNVSASPDHYHGEGAEKLTDILFKNYNASAVLAAFRSMGLLTHADREGRVYPLSNCSSSVLDILRRRMSELRVDELCGVTVSRIRSAPKGYEIQAGDRIIRAEKLVIAAGGRSDYAGRDSGSRELLRMLTAETTPLSPSLSPVKSDSPILKSLKGVRADAIATLIQDGRAVKSERGEVQFTPSALSGICVFNLSREINRSGGTVSLNLLPDMTDSEIADEIRSRVSRDPAAPVSEIFTGMFHKAIGAAILKSCGIKLSVNCKYISDKELNSIIHHCTDLRFSCEPCADFSRAQVTAGGVKLSEIDPATFESRRHKGLYIIGEALDVDGDCGGYNLQFAWASGMCAGDSL